jgi:hypothetical protein
MFWDRFVYYLIWIKICKAYDEKSRLFDKGLASRNPFINISGRHDRLLSRNKYPLFCVYYYLFELDPLSGWACLLLIYGSELRSRAWRCRLRWVRPEWIDFYISRRFEWKGTSDDEFFIDFCFVIRFGLLFFDEWNGSGFVCGVSQSLF